MVSSSIMVNTLSRYHKRKRLKLSRFKRHRSNGGDLARYLRLAIMYVAHDAMVFL